MVDLLFSWNIGVSSGDRLFLVLHSTSLRLAAVRVWKLVYGNGCFVYVWLQDRSWISRLNS